jgi:N-acetylmuramic acid 6-phosphate etherase
VHVRAGGSGLRVSDGTIRMPTQSKWQSLPTEAINPVSLAIDKAPVRDIIEMVVNEDRKVIAAVHKEKERIAHGIEIIAEALKKGGRVIFVGAGTSGRLGVGEASEMPPTFGPRVCRRRRPARPAGSRPR